jgi:hypothetical protein
MTVEIHCFTETLNSALKWEANNRHTYELATAPGNKPWPEMLPCFDEKNYALFGLLSMGVKSSYPFSFASRGFPQNASKEVRKMFQEQPDAYAATFIARDELTAKVGELTILPEEKALTVRPHLVEMIKKLPDPPTIVKHQRIVFWFVGK